MPNHDNTWVKQGKAAGTNNQKNALTPVIGGVGEPDIPKNPHHLTIHQVRAAAPLRVRKNITLKMVDLINSEIDNSDIRDEFRDHILSWVDVMQQGKWKFGDYINAVKYITHKLMGSTQQSAWVKVFPDRFQRMVDKGIPDKNIAAAITLYNQTELVLKITERTLPPLHVLNSDILQEAINVEATLMRDAKSETVRMKAAATLIEHLKPPETLKVDVSVGVSNDTVEDLRAITRGLAVQQQQMIESGGMSAGQIAEMSIVKKRELEREENVIEAEFESMEPESILRTNPLKDFFPGSTKVNK